MPATLRIMVVSRGRKHSRWSHGLPAPFGMGPHANTLAGTGDYRGIE